MTIFYHFLTDCCITSCLKTILSIRLVEFWRTDFLSIEGIEHTTTKAYSPQTNGMCERFNKTMKQEFFDTAMRKKIYTALDDLQLDLDIWLEYFNNERPHSGKYCYGKTPMQTFKDSKKLAVEKNNEILYLEYVSDSQNLTDNQGQNL